MLYFLYVYTQKNITGSLKLKIQATANMPKKSDYLFETGFSTNSDYYVYTIIRLYLLKIWVMVQTILIFT